MKNMLKFQKLRIIYGKARMVMFTLIVSVGYRPC